MESGKLTKHAQNLQGCEKHNLRKAVGNLELTYGCEITVILQEGLRNCYTSKLYKLMKGYSARRIKTCKLAQEGLINSYVK